MRPPEKANTQVTLMNSCFSHIAMETLSTHLQEWDTSADIKPRRRIWSLGKFPDKLHVLCQYQEDFLLGSVMQTSGVEEVWGPKRWESSIRLPNLTPPEYLACTANTHSIRNTQKKKWQSSIIKSGLHQGLRLPWVTIITMTKLYQACMFSVLILQYSQR